MFELSAGEKFQDCRGGEVDEYGTFRFDSEWGREGPSRRTKGSRR